MLVNGYKWRVEEEMGAKEQSRREWPSLMCHAWECLAQCLCDETSLLLSRVRFSKSETKPDVGLLPVPILQLLSSSILKRRSK